MSTYSNDITTGGTTTRSDDPEVIRRDIESTRADLSRNVDALTEKVSPSRVVRRRVHQASSVGSFKNSAVWSLIPVRGFTQSGSLQVSATMWLS